MRITFNCSTTETLEYLRTVNAILRSNQDVSANVKAYQALKDLTLSLGKRVNELEASARRSHVVKR